MMSTDQSTQVRDTVAWTLSRIVDLMLDNIDPSMVLGQWGSLGLIVECRVVLADQAAEGRATTVDDSYNPAFDDETQTSPLSQYYSDILKALMTVSERPTNDGNARGAAYQTISTFVGCSTVDTLPVVQEVFITLLARQEALMGMQTQLVGIDDRNNWNDSEGVLNDTRSLARCRDQLQEVGHDSVREGLHHGGRSVDDMQINICAVLQSAINRSPSMVKPFADRIMTNLLQLLICMSFQLFRSSMPTN
jgi:importin subunit beta-1